MEKPNFVSSSTITDFKLSCDGNDRLYSEKDLKKTVELVHSKMRRAMISVGVQYDEEKPTMRSVGVETKIHTESIGCSTDEQKLMISATGNISIDPSSREVSPAPSLSLKDMSKLPITRCNATQTTQGKLIGCFDGFRNEFKSLSPEV